MINEGQMSTEEAIELEESISSRFTDELKELLEIIGLSEEEIIRIESFQNGPPSTT